MKEKASLDQASINLHDQSNYTFEDMMRNDHNISTEQTVMHAVPNLKSNIADADSKRALVSSPRGSALAAAVQSDAQVGRHALHHQEA